MQANVRRKRVRIEWDDTANVSDGDSTDEDDDDNNDDDNDGDNEREDEPGAAVEELCLQQMMRGQAQLLDDNNDFSVEISKPDTNVTDSE